MISFQGLFSLFVLFFNWMINMILTLFNVRHYIQQLGWFFTSATCVNSTLCISFLCMIVIIYRILPYVRKIIKSFVIVVGSTSLVFLVRALTMALPVWWQGTLDVLLSSLATFDASVLQLTTYVSTNYIRSPTMLSTPNPIITFDSHAITSLTQVALIIGIVAVTAWILSCVVPVKNPLRGAVTRDHTRCATLLEAPKTASTDIATPPIPPVTTTSPSPPTPLCAPTSIEPLCELLKSILQPVNKHSSLETLLLQQLNNIRAELIAMIHQELTTLASTLTLTLPSATLTSQLIEDAVSRALLDLPERRSGQQATAREVDEHAFIGPVSSPYQSNTDPDDLPSPPLMNVAGSTWKTVRNQLRKTVKPATLTPPTTSTPKPTDMRTADELGEAELRDLLRVKAEARRDATQASQYLTDEEKLMSLGELHRKWKVEDQRRREERENLSRFDFEELGQLTEEQKLLPKAEVRRILRDRKNDTWVASMKAQGVPLHQCEVCQQLTTSNHRCMATRWMTEGQRGLRKGLVITQTGTGPIKLQEKQLIDQEQLNKEYEEIVKLKQQLDERTRKIAEAIRTEPTDATMSASSPTAASSSSNSSHVHQPAEPKQPSYV